MDAGQLRSLEALCKVLYESANESERAHAQQSVLILQSSAEYIPQCQYVLDNSSSPYALLVASNSLTKLITTHWNNFTGPQRVDIRAWRAGMQSRLLVVTNELYLSFWDTTQGTMCSGTWPRRVHRSRSS
jgi:hypothetical protein